MPRPAGVTAIAVLFFLAAAYLCVIGLTMLSARGAISMALGAPLLGGLETAGPYMFLLMAAFGALIGWGLLRLHSWARRVAMILAIIGVVLLVPSVSAAAVEFRASLIWGGLGIMVRVAVAWYLGQISVKEAFTRPAQTTD